MNRKMIGVIAAQAADMEQREILSGILAQAQQRNMDICVLSNIYNPNETDQALSAENAIYDLICTGAFDGFILISEAFINTELQQRIIRNLARRAALPVVAVGTPLPGFVLEHFRFINTDDKQDLRHMTDHLIEAHGFTDIAVLTGHDFVAASHMRVNGCMQSMEAHGIQMQPEKVYYGDFWMNSGEALAMRYIRGELPLPQAILCTNDYMAFGLLDTLVSHGIRVPEDVTVTGYEYVPDRIYHMPILTTYRRNRRGLGEEAVRQLCEKCSSGSYPDIPAFYGELIPGSSCPCGIRETQLNQELQSVRNKQTGDFLNLFSQFDHRLTECRDIEDILQVCREFHYLIDGVQEAYLCLYDHWDSDTEDGDAMLCYSILSQQRPLSLHSHEFDRLFSGAPAIYYLNPLFFSQKTLGYAVLKCSTPDVYNHTFRSWLKSIGNGLEVLWMKNDIRYLTRCQSLSGQYDPLTNLYNEKGMEAACHALKNGEHTAVILVLLKICITDNPFSDTEHKVGAIVDAADAVKAFCGRHDVCGRVSDTVFACFVVGGKGNAALYADRLSAVLMQKKHYMTHYGMDSFCCTAISCDSTASGMSLREAGEAALTAMTNTLAQRRAMPYYQEMLAIRNTVYCDPQQEYTADHFCTVYAFSTGHLRALYKKCFQISFYQDVINSRIVRAKYLLCTTKLHLPEIAEKCGYHDEKYFIRQFSKETGYTPHQYRSLI